MTTNPRWYERIRTFNEKYDVFINLYNSYDLDKIDDFQDAKLLMNSMKTCFELYHKSLKDLLQLKGIILYLPTDIFRTSQNLGIIKDSEVWIEYINDLNRYYHTYGTSELRNLAIYVVKKYYKKLNAVNDVLNSYFNSVTYNPVYEYKPLDTNMKPSYVPSDIDGIKQRSYNLLLNYFKFNKNVKYVWLHGSRAKGMATENADIDLLMDIEVEHVLDCKEALKQLAIPYRVDFVCINDLSMRDFYNKVVDDAKIIYRYTDF